MIKGKVIMKKGKEGLTFLEISLVVGFGTMAVAKLFGKFDYSWWVVTSPIWGYFLLYFSILLAVVMLRNHLRIIKKK